MSRKTECLAKVLRKGLLWLVCFPVILFLFLALLLYIPPVQQFAVRLVTSSLSESTGMNVSVEKVRLAFPLDLGVHRVTAIEGRDTLVSARSLRLNVRLRPLFKGRAEIDGFSLYNVRLNTKSYIPDTRIDGRAAELTAGTVAIDLKKERIGINRIRLDGADFFIALSDTAAADTSETVVRWNIRVDEAEINRSRVRLSMPGDSIAPFCGNWLRLVGKGRLRPRKGDLYRQAALS